jgi:hypothetical protein
MLFSLTIQIWAINIIDGTNENSEGSKAFFALAILLIGLGLLIPQWAVGTRRLHDVGKSGWLQLVWIIPFGCIVLIYYWLQSSRFEPDADDLLMESFDTNQIEYYHQESKGNQIIKRKFYVDGNQMIQGKDVIYYKSGKVNKIKNWENGVLQGECTTYYPNGKKYITSNYSLGKLNGDYMVFDKKQKLMEKFFYINGVKS